MKPLTVDAFEEHVGEAEAAEESFYSLLAFLSKVAHGHGHIQTTSCFLGFMGKLNPLIKTHEILTADVRLVVHSHDRFLPAARAYREYRERARRLGLTHLSDDPEFRRLRSALGGTSRQLYRLQKATFHALLDLVISFPWSLALTHARRERIWHKWQRVEAKWLAGARD